MSRSQQRVAVLSEGKHGLLDSIKHLSQILFFLSVLKSGPKNRDVWYANYLNEHLLWRFVRDIN